MYNPIATYRVQLHKDFTLVQLEAILPYLKKLGIKTVYASPVFSAVAGSTHGYDGINPEEINPEIGTIEDLRRIAAQVHELGMGWLQDIVPNHMAYHSSNEWLMDVLEHGQASQYAAYFDISWNNGEPIMAPFLGCTLEEAVEKGDLKLTRLNNQWKLAYFNTVFPVADETLADAVISSEADDSAANAVNNDKPALLQLANAQPYRLCHWQETDKHINYRRFFTVNGLICLNPHDKKVFEHVHRYAKSLLDEGLFNGLRIDHIDGLYDPTGYLTSLRSLTGSNCYTVVEKILEPKEQLPNEWPIQGTTGYEFSAAVNQLFTQQKSKAAFTRFYKKLSGEKLSIQQQLYRKKAHILSAHMKGELTNLTNLFLSLDLEAADAAILRPAIAAFLIYCPVYRYYGNSLPLNTTEAKAVHAVFDKINADQPKLVEGIAILQRAILEKPAEGNEEYNGRALRFYQRCMQFTGPLMAKGMEDTLMYTHALFIGHNEVGDSPDQFGMSGADFHKAMQHRQQHWPLSLNTTATHDTKRGEDARALLNILTEVPAEWTAAVTRWQELNKDLKTGIAPDAVDEYFIYQTLFATCPFEGGTSGDYENRLAEYLQKALREAKRNSDWATVNKAYETATITFAKALLQPDSAFWADFSAFRRPLLDFGLLQALAQVVLRFTCPGVPDTYQGTELWDLSLVDPDNRRTVAYEQRSQWLDELAQADSEILTETLWQERTTGKIKLWLVQQLLKLRADDEELFAKGRYIPLQVTGRYKENILAFARHYEHRWLIVIVPLHLTQLEVPPVDIDWQNTAVVLPAHAPAKWQQLFNSNKGTHTGTILLKEVAGKLPFAILQFSGTANGRGAGILMPVTALPSPYSIGDMGPEARRFIESLAQAGQSYWQLLPMNPVSAESSFSPYSSISAMAGNTLLISPDLLVQDGLLTQAEADRFQSTAEGSVDYNKAVHDKSDLLDIAFERYMQGGFPVIEKLVACYKEEAGHWLDDFALFVVIKRGQGEQPWHEWPAELRNRNAEALRTFALEHDAAIHKIIWQQAIFTKQWRELRAHANNYGLKLIGDLPFYASYDSTDAWAHPELFSLDKGGSMTGIAGVPPDYFSNTGQLWGMPTYQWQEHQKNNYEWWISRLRKNLELYDVLRIDHFRALAGYWEVPAGEETAVKGQWLPGPGTHFFDAVRKAVGGLPFIAEDLGDEMNDVYKLRDDVGLPGMKVLQFAFGDNLPSSVDVPHNYGKNFIAYTGTHDNNTTLGWFRQETKPADRARIALYTNRQPTERNINELMAKMVYASVANTAILPMQDVLKLDEKSRMNMPSSACGNWAWRLKSDAFTDKHIKWLLAHARFYNRL